MAETGKSGDRVAVLVDCDNTSPEILEYALRVIAQYGRVVVRRGYGNHSTLANKWQEALVRLAFTPCLQYQYASGKNTSDIALALDALENLFDNSADTYCLVTSDSDFAYLCRKLRERGATVCIVGEEKTPDALRNASDQFFEYVPPESDSVKADAGKTQKLRRSKALRAAVTLLAADTSEGWVGLGELGQYMRRTDPGFTPQKYGHSGLLEMISTYSDLEIRRDGGGHWVQPRSSSAAIKEPAREETTEVVKEITKETIKEIKEPSKDAGKATTRGGRRGGAKTAVKDSPK